MQKGGYQIIDLKDHAHTSGVGAIHEGIYDKIEGTKKPILLSGIVVNAIEFHDTFIFPCVNGSNFVAVVGVFAVVRASNINGRKTARYKNQHKCQCSQAN